MKKYVLTVGDRQFVFGSLKGANAAYEVLETAEFVGKPTWRRSNSLEECSPDLNVRTVDGDQLKCMSQVEAEILEATDEYKRAARVYSKSDDEDRQDNEKRLNRAVKALADLGIDPSTIDIEED